MEGNREAQGIYINADFYNRQEVQAAPDPIRAGDFNPRPARHTVVMYLRDTNHEVDALTGRDLVGIPLAADHGTGLQDWEAERINIGRRRPKPYNKQVGEW